MYRYGLNKIIVLKRLEIKNNQNIIRLDLNLVSKNRGKNNLNKN